MGARQQRRGASCWVLTSFSLLYLVIAVAALFAVQSNDAAPPPRASPSLPRRARGGRLRGQAVSGAPQGAPSASTSSSGARDEAKETGKERQRKRGSLIREPAADRDTTHNPTSSNTKKQKGAGCKNVQSSTDTPVSSPLFKSTISSVNRHGEKNNDSRNSSNRQSSSSAADRTRRSSRLGEAAATKAKAACTEAANARTASKRITSRGGSRSSNSRATGSLPQAAGAAEKPVPHGRHLRSSSRKETPAGGNSQAKSKDSGMSNKKEKITAESTGESAKPKRRRLAGAVKKEETQEALKENPSVKKELEAREGVASLLKQQGEGNTKEQSPDTPELAAEIKALEEKLRRHNRYSRPRYMFRVRVFRGSVVLRDEEIDVPIEEQCPDAPADSTSPR